MPVSDRVVQWPTKPPGSRLDYAFDLTGWLAAAPGDTITSASVGAEPNDGSLSVDAPEIDGAKITIWVEGGEHGTRYAVTVDFETADGRTDQVVALLPVEGLAEAVEDRVGADQVGV